MYDKFFPDLLLL